MTLSPKTKLTCTCRCSSLLTSFDSDEEDEQITIVDDSTFSFDKYELLTFT